jgi:hypothetical protein
VNPERRFCINCGNPLEAGAKFCAYCGSPLSGAQSTSSSPSFPLSPPRTPIAPEPAAPLATAPADNERIIGVIPGISRKKGMFKIEAYHVVVTEKRLIFALVTNQTTKEEAQKSSGKGFGSFLKTALSGNDMTQRYLSVPPEQSLHETPDNFDVVISRIRKVKIQKGGGYMDEGKEADGKLIIETVGDKLSFMLRNPYYDIAIGILHKAELV